MDFAMSPSKGGNRIYVSYTGSAPSSATLNTYASDVATSWNTNLAPLIHTGNQLQEVDVLDIATTSGAFGIWTGTHNGTRAGTALPNNCCLTIEYDIARRYRGGKPRCYLPAGIESDLLDQAHWQSTFLSTANTDFAAFITAITGVTISGTTFNNHVNLSYYQGFHNVTNTSGRTRAVPTYRTPNAIHDNVTNYAAKAEVASQRRRRQSTSY